MSNRYALYYAGHPASVELTVAPAVGQGSRLFIL